METLDFVQRAPAYRDMSRGLQSVFKPLYKGTHMHCSLGVLHLADFFWHVAQAG